MQGENLISKLALAYFVSNSLCLLILIELIIFKRSFLVLFLVIFYLCYKINLQLFSKHFFGKKIHSTSN